MSNELVQSETEKWSIEDVCDWLSKLKMSDETIKTFKSEEVNGIALLNLSLEEIKNLGVKQIPAKTIYQFIEKSKAKEVDPKENIQQVKVKEELHSYQEIFKSKKKILIKDVQFQIEKIGEGGEGQVFIGKYHGEDYATKRIPKTSSKNEIDTILLIDDPNVIHCHFWSEDDVFYYYLMDMMDGSLYDALYKGKTKLTETERFKIICDVSHGISVLHQNKIIHRDLKPQNILYTRNKIGNLIVKIADFGISATNESPQIDLFTKTGMGTMVYLPPEFVQQNIYGYYTDIYAFGVICFELIYQEFPWKNCKSGDDIFIELYQGNTPSSQTKLPKQWLAIKELIDQCFKKKDERPEIEKIIFSLQKVDSSLFSKTNDIISEDKSNYFDFQNPWENPKKCMEDWNSNKNDPVYLSLFYGACLWKKQTSHAANAKDLLLESIDDCKSKQLQSISYGIMLRVEEKYQESLKCFLEYKEHFISQYFIGLIMYYGSGVQKDYSGAFKWFKSSHEKGCLNATYFMALCYFYGNGVTLDYIQAIKYFRIAAEKEISMAQYMMGFCYKYGHGINKSNEDAIGWFATAACQDNRWALYFLGHAYFKGEGIEMDKTKAFKYFSQSSDEIEWSQYFVGYCYKYGEGVSKSETESVKWLKMAADKGNKSASYHLGECYQLGLGINKDLKEAGRLFLVASGRAQEGDQWGQYYLGCCCKFGYYYKLDKKLARQWFEMSAKQGNEYAKYQLNNLD